MTAIKDWSIDRKKEYLGYALMFLCYILVALFAPQLAEGENYGIWTLVPPLSIFAFILLTKKILEGFFWSSLLTVFIRYRWGFMGGFVDDMFENVTNWDNWWVIYLFLLAGSITYLFKISGAGTYFARWIAKRIKNKKIAMFVTSLVLWPLCIDDYMSALVTGSVFSPLLDTYKVPREMTAYIIRADSYIASDRSMGDLRWGCIGNVGSGYYCKYKRIRLLFFKGPSIFIFPGYGNAGKLACDRRDSSQVWKDEKGI